MTIRILQRYDWLVNAEQPHNTPPKFHHTIENRSGTGVKVWLHEYTGVRPRDFWIGPGKDDIMVFDDQHMQYTKDDHRSPC